jgi:hypothetical protein
LSSLQFNCCESANHDLNLIRFLYFIGVTTVLFNAITSILIFAQCSPAAKLWDDDLAGSCNKRSLNQDFAFFQGSKSACPRMRQLLLDFLLMMKPGWSSFCDAALALYPITVFWKLQLNFKLKIGLCVLMGVGLMYGLRSNCERERR